MSRRLAIVPATLTALVAGLLIAPPAHAAPTWLTPPTTLSTAGTGLSSDYPQVGVADDGDVLAVWRELNSVAGAERLLFADRPAGGSWSASDVISGAGDRVAFDPQLAVNAAGDAAVAWVDAITNQVSAA